MYNGHCIILSMWCLHPCWVLPVEAGVIVFQKLPEMTCKKKIHHNLLYALYTITFSSNDGGLQVFIITIKSGMSNGKLLFSSQDGIA